MKNWNNFHEYFMNCSIKKFVEKRKTFEEWNYCLNFNAENSLLGNNLRIWNSPCVPTWPWFCWAPSHHFRQKRSPRLASRRTKMGFGRDNQPRQKNCTQKQLNHILKTYHWNERFNTNHLGGPSFFFLELQKLEIESFEIYRI